MLAPASVRPAEGSPEAATPCGSGAAKGTEAGVRSALVMAKDLPGPPRTGAREGAEAVVEDQRVRGGDAERGGSCREGGLGGHHVGQRLGAVRDAVDVKELAARDPCRLELLGAAAACNSAARHKHRRCRDA